MELLIPSFLAGVLTVLTPCVLPFLPVIVGGSIQSKSKLRIVVITLSLGISLIVFTLLLKVSTLLIDVNPNFWKYFSGTLILFLGIVLLLPKLWTKLTIILGLSTKSNQLLDNANQRNDLLGGILTGVALGPVFSSCSPTYAVILSVVFPQSIFEGLIYILAYVLGISVVMFLVSIFGQQLVLKLKWSTNPNGLFKKFIGFLFIIIGILIITGLDKRIETYLIDTAFVQRIVEVDINLAN